MDSQNRLGPLVCRVELVHAVSVVESIILCDSVRQRQRSGRPTHFSLPLPSSLFATIQALPTLQKNTADDTV